MDFRKIEIRLTGEIFNPEISSFNIEFKNRYDMILAIKRTEIKLQYGAGDCPVSYSLPSDSDIEINNNLLKFLTTIKRSEWMS